MSKQGIIYVLSNPAMPDYVKIGKTSRNVEERMKDLNNTSVPFSFICERASMVADVDNVEKKIHSAFSNNRVNTKREFFEIDANKIIDILELVEIENVTPTFVAESKEEEIETLKAVKNVIRRRDNFNFTELNIKIGEKLSFVYDKEITVVVVSDKKVEFRGEILSITKSAKIVLGDMGKYNTNIAGTDYWEYDNETICNMRKRLDQEKIEQDDD